MKSRIVLRLLRGDDLELLSREYGATAAQISRWRDDFLSAGEVAMKKREDPESDEIKRLREKLGEVTMESELLREKIKRLEGNRPLPRRRSRK
jgi:transposase-like protein